MSAIYKTLSTMFSHPILLLRPPPLSSQKLHQSPPKQMNNLLANMGVKKEPLPKRRMRDRPWALQNEEKNNFDLLDDEINVEILVRLPLKSVFVCRCVCKRWCSLLSTTTFIHLFISKPTTNQFGGLFLHIPGPACKILHPQHLSSNPISYLKLRHATSSNPPFRFVVNPPTRERPDPRYRGFALEFLPRLEPRQRYHPNKFSPPIEENPIHVLGISNGLLLCSHAMFDQMVYFVCNPQTTQWVVLPLPPNCHREVRVGFVAYPPDPEDPACTSHYRVVRVIPRKVTDADSNCDFLYMETFNSRTGSWRESGVLVSPLPNLAYTFPKVTISVSVKGIIYWIDSAPFGSGGNVVAYDPVSGDCRVIPFPIVLVDMGFGRLGESDGQLKYAGVYLVDADVQGSHPHSHPCIIVWSIKDDGKELEWLVDHCVDCAELVSDHPSVAAYLCHNGLLKLDVVAFHPFDKSVLFVIISDSFVTCNLQTKQVERICSITVTSYYAIMWTVVPYLLPKWPVRIALPPCD